MVGEAERRAGTTTVTAGKMKEAETAPVSPGASGTTERTDTATVKDDGDSTTGVSPAANCWEYSEQAANVEGTVTPVTKLVNATEEEVYAYDWEAVRADRIARDKSNIDSDGFETEAMVWMASVATN